MGDKTDGKSSSTSTEGAPAPKGSQKGGGSRSSKAKEEGQAKGQAKDRNAQAFEEVQAQDELEAQQQEAPRPAWFYCKGPHLPEEAKAKQKELAKRRPKTLKQVQNAARAQRRQLPQAISPKQARRYREHNR